MPNAAMAGSSIAAPADLTGAADVVEVLLAWEEVWDDDDVVVEVCTVVDGWLVVVGDDDTSDDDEVDVVSDTEVVELEIVIELDDQVALPVNVVASASASLVVVAATASILVLDRVGIREYQDGLTAY